MDASGLSNETFPTIWSKLENRCVTPNSCFIRYLSQLGMGSVEPVLSTDEPVLTTDEPVLTTTIRFDVFISDVEATGSVLRFTKNVYRAEVPESARPGHVVVQVTANGIAKNTTGNISYFIEDDPVSRFNRFLIDKSTGEISVFNRINCEAGTELTFIVHARMSVQPRWSGWWAGEVQQQSDR